MERARVGSSQQSHRPKCCLGTPSANNPDALGVHTSPSQWARAMIAQRPVFNVVCDGRFPQPWTSEDSGVSFIVKDAKGHRVAFVCYEEEPGQRAASNLMTRHEARRIAANIANLPELLRRPQY
jgi:hypothetical protein